MLWIPITDKTPDKEQILKASGILGRSPNEVLGATVRFWLWAVVETQDGFIPGCSQQTIDHVARVEGYASAMIKAGWILEDDRGIVIVGWDEYLSKAARAKAQAHKRKARERGNG